MNCNEVQKSLVLFLEGEIAAAEAQRIRQHVSECEACRKDLVALTSARYTAAQALQSRARQVQPSSEAWSNLEARLAKEARPSPTQLSAWIARLVPGGIAAVTPLFQGKIPMRTRTIITAIAAVAALTIFAIFMVKNVTPVSAQQILERGYEVQSPSSAQGIQHIRVETQRGILNATEEPTRISTVMDNYYDYQTGNNRLVITNTDTGAVLDAYAYDGSYSYSGTRAENASGPLTIYRVPQPQEKLSQNERPTSSVEITQKMFDQALNNPDVKISGKENWSDDRTAYILTFQQPAQIATDNNVEVIIGTTQMVFDAETYQLLENQQSIQKDGKETLVNSQKYLTNEILPSDTPVAWDFSDLAGVTVVDDPNGDFGDMLPEVITVQELAANPQVYLLDFIPEGFELEITSPPRQENEEAYIYVASYRNEADDYFVIQTYGNLSSGSIEHREFTEEIYTSASGLEFHFSKPTDLPGGKQVISTLLAAMDGVSYTITSTLPLDQVKELLEHMTLVQE